MELRINDHFWLFSNSNMKYSARPQSSAMILLSTSVLLAWRLTNTFALESTNQSVGKFACFPWVATPASQPASQIRCLELLILDMKHLPVNTNVQHKLDQSLSVVRSYRTVILCKWIFSTEDQLKCFLEVGESRWPTVEVLQYVATKVDASIMTQPFLAWKA